MPKRHCFPITILIKIAAVFLLAALPPIAAPVAVESLKYKSRDATELNLALPLNKCWEFNFNETGGFSPQVTSDNADDYIYLATNKKLESFDSVSAKTVWTSDLEAPVTSNIALDSASLYFTVRARSASGVVYDNLKSVDRTTGLINWQVGLPPSIGLSGVPSEVKSEDKIYVAVRNEKIIIVGPLRHLVDSGQNGIIYVLKAIDGDLISSRRVADINPSLIIDVSDNTIFVGTNSAGIVVAATADTNGAELQTGGTVSALTVLPDETIVYGDKKGFVYRMRTKQTKSNSPVWKFRTGAEISFVVKTIYGMLVSSNDNYLYLIDTDNGKLIWKRRLASRITGRPLITTIYAVIANLAQPEIDVIDLRDGKIINRLFLKDESYAVTDLFFQNDLLILSTLRGVLALSTGECRAKRKR